MTLILCVDPLLEPGNGPNWFPYDPDILYELKVDNNNDAVEDITFQFRFATTSRNFNVQVGDKKNVRGYAVRTVPEHVLALTLALTATATRP